jgi:CTP:phosphocholine cytidylyltransferase-like protein
MSNLDKQIQQGQKAKQLLNDPLLKEAFEYLAEQYKSEIFNTSYNDHDQRQVLWMAYNMLDKIKGHLVSVMETGKLASSELENLTRQSTK